MSEAERWLAAHVEHAPEQLRATMLNAVRETSAATVAQHLAQAGMICLRKALRDPAKRPSALELLAADALFTHACQAAAHDGAESVVQFAQTWSALRFEELLTSANE